MCRYSPLPAVPRMGRTSGFKTALTESWSACVNCMMRARGGERILRVVATISVLVVDDHRLFADALRARLAREPDLGPVEAELGPETAGDVGEDDEHERSGGQRGAAEREEARRVVVRVGRPGGDSG